MSKRAPVYETPSVDSITAHLPDRQTHAPVRPAPNQTKTLHTRKTRATSHPHLHSTSHVPCQTPNCHCSSPQHLIPAVLCGWRVNPTHPHPQKEHSHIPLFLDMPCDLHNLHSTGLSSHHIWFRPVLSSKTWRHFECPYSPSGEHERYLDRGQIAQMGGCGSCANLSLARMMLVGRGRRLHCWREVKWRWEVWVSCIDSGVHRQSKGTGLTSSFTARTVSSLCGLFCVSRYEASGKMRTCLQL